MSKIYEFAYGLVLFAQIRGHSAADLGVTLSKYFGRLPSAGWQRIPARRRLLQNQLVPVSDSLTMVIDYQEAALLAIGSIGPIVLAARAFLNRERIYAAWAKLVYVLASVAALGWGILGAIVWPPFRPAPYRYFFLLVALRYVFGGMVIGFLLSVVLARPSEKRR